MSVKGEGLRASFKEGLGKLLVISTREQANRQLRSLIAQNKTTINLRLWLSVLSEQRQRHPESQINVLAFIVQEYGKGLLDPLDKIPSLQKTVFRVAQLLTNLYFREESPAVGLALQRAWTCLYLGPLDQEDPALKKKLLYDSLQAILSGGADRVSQCTAQVVLQGLLEAALNREDLFFFKQIAKRALVLFMKTTIEHPAVLSCLQTVLGYFNVCNLVSLLPSITAKILGYLPLAQNNSNGYKLRVEAANALGLIGEQIDQAGLTVEEKVITALQDLATDRVWAVQAAGRKALAVWKAKKKLWSEEHQAKQQQYFPSAQQFWQGGAEQPAAQGPRAQTASQFRPRSPSPQPQGQGGRFLLKQTGAGGGNTVFAAEQYVERQKPQETHSRKMDEIKKSIYGPKDDFTEYDETIHWDSNQILQQPTPNPPPPNQTHTAPPERPTQTEEPLEEVQGSDEQAYLAGWLQVMALMEAGHKEEGAKAILRLDDDVYFLRFMLRYGRGLLADLTRSTASRVLKQTLALGRSHFMDQMLLKMAAETAKSNTAGLLTTQQALSVSQGLRKASQAPSLERPATKVRRAFEKSLERGD